MATANKVFVSPGVYTSERDLSFVAQSVGVTTLGIVGETLSGPAFEPIFITNFDEFQAYFGGTNPTKFVNTQIPKYEAAYIAKAYLQQSNQLFVTRVLGLSGYDAGPSWSIKTVGNLDSSGTTAISVAGPFTIEFSGTSGDSTTISVTDYSSLPTSIQGVITFPYTTYTGGESTILGDMEDLLYGEIVSPTSSGSTSYFWGSVSASTFNNVTGATPNYSANTNVLEVDDISFENCDLTASENDPWYYALFSESSNVYSGVGFGMGVTGLTNTTGNDYSGTAAVYLTNYTGTPMSEYHNLVVATLRSRGIATYSTDDGPVYEVSGLTDVLMDCTGEYSAVTKNPFETFAISGITIDGDKFNFKTSFNVSNANYISKVFGKSNFAKPRTEVPLFLEEEYYSMLNIGYRKGMIRGLDCDLLSLDGARTDTANTGIGWYLDRYQTPETPYVVSELRGTQVYNMFKFITVSDGNSANREVKISIINISFNNGTFDIVVRDFFDTDANPVVLEKFTNCTMDPNQNSFVAKKIGTANGDFELKSRYIMLEMNEDAPIDSLPCGFRGYLTRQYSGSKSPFLEYKTEYYRPGQVIFNPPFGNASGSDNETRAAGDKVRKVYLGVSNTMGIDSDFFQYKGKQNPLNLTTATSSQPWAYLTKGFHMDSGATIVTIPADYVTSGQSSFEVGVGKFRGEPQDESNPYYKLNTRKFTLAPSGGFDGWDIYREYRTNGDRYQLGATGYRKGAAPSINYPNSTGWGAFKQITGPDQLTWGNTDYYSYLWGQHTFHNPEAININVFTTPGIDYFNNSNLIEEAIDMVETDRADSIYICTTPDYQMFTPTLGDFDTNFIYPEEAVDNLEETGIDSNYSATYYPWVLTRDTVNNTQIYLPPTAEVVRNLALTDNIAFPWFASAGYTRGLVNAVKARKKLTQEDRDILYKGRLNPIATFSDVGTVIWGNKTLQVRESALDRINVRRLLLQARKLISAVAVRLLFEQNDEQVRQEFLDSVNPILDGIRRDRGLIDFRVTVSNTPEDLDSNTLTGKIYLKPTRALEFIDIEFLITPTGASFEDI
jgi:hypothetical protein